MFLSVCLHKNIKRKYEMEHQLLFKLNFKIFVLFLSLTFSLSLSRSVTMFNNLRDSQRMFFRLLYYLFVSYRELPL